MSQLARIVDVEHLGEHRLRLTFSDALVRELDFSEAARDWGGVLEPLCDPAFFGQVAVDPGWRAPSPGRTAWTSIQTCCTATTNRRAGGLPRSSSSITSARRPDRSSSGGRSWRWWPPALL